MFGSIPKSKALSDFAAIKRAFRIVREGGIVGLFPEGQNSWDGATQPLRPETAKLIKRFGVALFMAKLHGSHFVLPRWGHGLRRGLITIHYHKIYSEEEVARHSVTEIARQMEQRLRHNEYTSQQQRRAPYGGRYRAEFIEQFLFLCPICLKAQTIYSRRHSIYCKDCGLLATLNQQGLFQSGGLTSFSTLYDWGQWQRSCWRTQLQQIQSQKMAALLLVDNPVRLALGYRNRPLSPLAEGRLELYPTYLALRVSNEAAAEDQSRTFDIQMIEGNNVQHREILEFYYKRALYSFWIKQEVHNAYKWHLSIDLLREILRH